MPTYFVNVKRRILHTQEVQVEVEATDPDDADVKAKALAQNGVAKLDWEDTPDPAMIQACWGSSTWENP